MLLIADRPTAAEGLIDAAHLRRTEVEALPREIGAIWRRLSAARTAWIGEVERAGTSDPGPRHLLAVEHADSSQFTALQAALRDEVPVASDLATIALAGSGFRGQRGREWQALRGNLHLCLLARLGLSVAGVQPALTALPAVAAVRAVARATNDATRLRLKWVNDLMLAGRKVGGVLSATHLTGPLVSYLLVGIGINLARTPELARHPSAPPAGSLADGAVAPDHAALTLALLAELDAAVAQLRAGGGDELVAAYRRYSTVVGRHVAIWPVADDPTPRAPLVTGHVVALRPDLAIELEGHSEPLYGGRLTFVDDRDDVGQGTCEDG